MVSSLFDDTVGLISAIQMHTATYSCLTFIYIRPKITYSPQFVFIDAVCCCCCHRTYRINYECLHWLDDAGNDHSYDDDKRYTHTVAVACRHQNFMKYFQNAIKWISLFYPNKCNQCVCARRTFLIATGACNFGSKFEGTIGKLISVNSRKSTIKFKYLWDTRMEETKKCRHVRSFTLALIRSQNCVFCVGCVIFNSSCWKFERKSWQEKRTLNVRYCPEHFTYIFCKNILN